VEFFGLSPIELLVIVVVAIVVFGQRLPQVAGETAATLQRFKRSLTDLRRETGIDQEIYKAKREFEEAQRQARAADPRLELTREAAAAKAQAAALAREAALRNEPSGATQVSGAAELEPTPPTGSIPAGPGRPDPGSAGTNPEAGTASHPTPAPARPDQG
jgi:TatA/E family protein of Tat protein translocase